ncbi:hypothetical protein F7725_009047, partial [Dissostichus mawsoni]
MILASGSWRMHSLSMIPQFNADWGVSRMKSTSGWEQKYSTVGLLVPICLLRMFFTSDSSSPLLYSSWASWATVSVISFMDTRHFDTSSDAWIAREGREREERGKREGREREERGGGEEKRGETELSLILA